MATETQRLLIEIEVDADQATKAIVNQKQALDQLKKEKAELLAQNKALAAQENVDTAAIQKNNEAIVQKEAKIKNLSTEIKSNEKIVQAATKTTNDETGAYQQLALQYQVAAQKAKDMAVVHGVNSDEAKKATKAASDMSDQLKEVDASVGQNQRSVGDYGLALRGLGGNFMQNMMNVDDFTKANGGLAGSFQAGGQAVGGFGKQLLALLANPIVAIIAAVAAAVMLMVEAIKSNGEATEKLNQVMAPFKTILSAVMNVVAQLAIFILDGVKALMDFGAAILSIIPGMKSVQDETKKTMELEKERQQLAEEERQDMISDSEDRLKVSALKKELARADKYTAEERIKMAREIDAIEKANMLDDLQRQQRRHANLLAQMKAEGKSYKDLTTEQKEAFVASASALNDLQADYLDKTKKVGAKEAALVAEMEAEKTKANEEAEAKRKEAQERYRAARQKAQEDELKKQQNNITILKNAYVADYEDSKLIDKNYFDSKQKALTDIHNAEIALIDKKKQYGKLTIEEEKIARADADKSYVDSQNKLSADLNEELAKRLSAQFKLEELQLKKQLLGVKKNEAERFKATIDGIDKKYEQEKKLIELTVTDETDKAEKLKLLNAQYNLDIATENQANFERNKAQKLADEAGLAQAEFDLRKDTIDKEFDQKQAALKKEYDDRLATVTAGSAAEFAIKKAYDEKEGELDRLRNLAKAQNIVDWAGQLADIMSGVIDVLNAFGERELANFEKVKNAELQKQLDVNQAGFDDITLKYNADVKALDEKFAAGILSKEEYDKARKELDKNYSEAEKALAKQNADAEKKIQDELDEKKAEIEYQAAKRAKALAIVNAIINGASGVIAALATPIIGPILAIAAGVVAAANLAAIIATPIPDNRKGGGGGGSGGGSLPSTAGLGEALNGGSTTNGIVTGNANGSDVVNNQNLINEINKNGGQQPVLVTSDLTKVQEREARIAVMNEI